MKICLICLIITLSLANEIDLNQESNFGTVRRLIETNNSYLKQVEPILSDLNNSNSDYMNLQLSLNSLKLDKNISEKGKDCFHQQPVQLLKH